MGLKERERLRERERERERESESVLFCIRYSLSIATRVINK